MKKVKNMNIDEAKQAFAKFEAKHPRNDDFDMNSLLMLKYAELLGKSNREELLTLICDIFNHGFMCGYKQSEASQKSIAESLKQYETRMRTISARPTTTYLQSTAGRKTVLQMSDERKQIIEELAKEVEEISNIAKIRFILGVIRSYKKGVLSSK